MVKKRQTGSFYKFVVATHLIFAGCAVVEQLGRGTRAEKGSDEGRHHGYYQVQDMAMSVLATPLDMQTDNTKVQGPVVTHYVHYIYIYTNIYVYIYIYIYI